MNTTRCRSNVASTGSLFARGTGVSRRFVPTVAVWLVLMCGMVTAAALGQQTRYVDADSANPVPPYTSWATASTSIWEATTISVDGDTVWVTNGAFAPQIDLTNGIAVRSVNGPKSVVIDGQLGDGPMRIAHSNAVLDGFTITRRGNGFGGGIVCEAGAIRNCVIANNGACYDTGGVLLQAGLVEDCVIVSNAGQYGVGGVKIQGGIMRRCRVEANVAGPSPYGGGGSGGISCWPDGRIENCVVVGNRTVGPYGISGSCGGVSLSGAMVNSVVVGNLSGTNGGVSGSGTIRNCIICFNQADHRPNGTIVPSSNVSHSCFIGFEPGNGNIDADPQFRDRAGGDYTLLPMSPCIDAGSAEDAPSDDMDGRPRPVDGDLDGLPMPDMGACEMDAACAARYVDAASAHPAAPFLSWGTAARTIQDALCVAHDGEVVLVAPGVYRADEAIVVSNAVTLRGVEQAARPIVRGRFRQWCVRVAHPGARLERLVIERGRGGVLIERGGVLCDCIVRDNRRFGTRAYPATGGGIVAGDGAGIERCEIARNAADRGAGASLAGTATMTGCEVRHNTARQDGGGLALSGASAARECIIARNACGRDGGGVWASDVDGARMANCVVDRNTALRTGGGVRAAIGLLIENCTLANNRAFAGVGGVDGRGTVRNSILWGNRGRRARDYGTGALSISHSCASPLASGPGNIDADPVFLAADDADYCLASTSPCIDAGLWEGAPDEDIAGMPRPLDGDMNGSFLPDMGAHEYLPPRVAHFVSGSSSNPAVPYLTWKTAAHEIQPALDVAATGATVFVGAGDYTGRITIAKNVTILGDDARTTFVSGGGPVFTVEARCTSRLERLTIRRGRAWGGSGLLNSGTTFLRDCHITENRTALECRRASNYGDYWDSGAGGGILNEGRITAENCTVSSNATEDASGIGSSGHGGGIYNKGAMSLLNCTVSGNRVGDAGHVMRDVYRPPYWLYGAAGSGGGICNRGTLELRHCTITDNECGDAFLGYQNYRQDGAGAGIATTGRVIMTHTIISGNRRAGAYLGSYDIESISRSYGYASRPIESEGYNLFGVSSGIGFSGQTGTDVRVNNPRLLPLADNGGQTPTHAPSASSAAVDHGDPLFSPPPETDQCGAPRVQGARIDIGAVETAGAEVPGYWLSARDGPAAGGNLVTISRAGLGNGRDITNVTICGIQAQIVTQGLSFVVVHTGADGFGTGDVVIHSEALGTTILRDAYSYSVHGHIYEPQIQWNHLCNTPGWGASEPQAVVLDGTCCVLWDRLRLFLFHSARPSGEWNYPARLPDRLFGLQMVAVDGRLLVCGYERRQCRNVPCAYGMELSDPVPSWTVEEGFAGTALHSNLVVIGDQAFGSSADWTTLDAYDPALPSDGWQPVVAMPRPGVSNAMAVAFEGRVCVIYPLAGGCSMFDPQRPDDGWTDRALPPCPRDLRGCRLVTCHGRVWMLGGQYLSEYRHCFWWRGVWCCEPRFEWKTSDASFSFDPHDPSPTWASNTCRGFTSAGVDMDGERLLCVEQAEARVGSFGSGVSPSFGPVTGGSIVVISGSHLCHSRDVTNVTLCGISADAILFQSPTQVVVRTGPSSAPIKGNVSVYSTSHGTTTRSNAYAYGSDCSVLGSNGAFIADGASPDRYQGTDFETLAVGTEMSRTLSLSAPAEPLSVRGVSITGRGAASFSVAGVPGTVDSLCSSNFVVRFRPDGVGLHTAVVEIANNSATDPYRTVVCGLGYALSANNGPFEGGNTVALQVGSLEGAGDITRVTLCGVPAELLSQDRTQVVVRAGAGGYGCGDVVIDSEFAGTTRIRRAYTYNAPGYIVGDFAGWNAVSNLPAGRYGFGMVSAAGRVYVLGGAQYGSPGQDPRAVLVYDPSHPEQGWTGIQDLPEGRQHMGAAGLDGRIFALGGTTNFQVDPAESRIARACDVARPDDGWVRLDDLPQPMYDASVVSGGGRVYAFGAGGVDTHWRDGCLQYTGADPCFMDVRRTSSGWCRVPTSFLMTCDETLSHSVAVWVDGRIYATGFISLPETVFGMRISRMDVYDTASDENGWQSSTNVPPGYYRLGPVWAAFAGRIYSIGMAVQLQGAPVSTNVFYEFDPAQPQARWRSLPAPPGSNLRKATATGERIYASNGSNVFEGRFSSGVVPDSGPCTGGIHVVITGRGLGDNDITNVTLCGFSARSILSQSATQVVVIAGPSGVPVSGDVAVQSESRGITIRSNAFAYTGWGALSPIDSGATDETRALQAMPCSGASPLLSVLTFDAGGVASGTQMLSWAVGGSATSGTVRLDFSADAGATWTLLGSNTPACAGWWLWDSTLFPDTTQALWRVMLEQDPSVFDVNDHVFVVSNGTGSGGTPTLHALTFNSGGVARDQVLLQWESEGIEAGEPVQVDFSATCGDTWTTLGFGIPASAGQYAWDSSLSPDTTGALWRVVLMSDTNVQDACDHFFCVHNGTTGATHLIHYVDVNSANPVSPYTSWATAARVIQDAVDVASDGDTVLVADGVYDTGGRVRTGGDITNRVMTANAIIIRSVNGPERTSIVGAPDPILTNGLGGAAVRCVYLGNGAMMSGFTLTNGHTREVRLAYTWGYPYWYRQYWDENDNQGGGAYLVGGTLSNCVLAGNAGRFGGGAYGGILCNCVLRDNWAYNDGGGADHSELFGCEVLGNRGGLGGGVCRSELHGCTIKGNWGGYGGGALDSEIYDCVVACNTGHYGGGVFNSSANNSLFTGNQAGQGGGGDYVDFYSCTVVGNSAAQGGGIARGTLRNCIVYHNHAPTGANFFSYECNPVTLTNCCTTPLPPGTGNITKDPQFVDAAAGDFRLLASSPCINAGTNQDWMIGATDIDGNPRIAGEIVDMGAYEFQGDPATNPPFPGLHALTFNSGGLARDQVLLQWESEEIEAGEPVQVDFSATCGDTWTTLGFGIPASAGQYVWDSSLSPDTTGALWRVVLMSDTNVQDACDHFFCVHNGTTGATHLIHYVDVNSANPVSPYTSWATAARVIQDAVDVASDGDTVLVADGVYDQGGVAGYPAGSLLTNRVAIDKPITVRSVNGPEVTIIKGAKDSITTNGDAAVRCVWMRNGAELIGFTLTNGATKNTYDIYDDCRGGGAWCQGTDAVISNCIISGNSADYHGGGVYEGAMYNCVLQGNSAPLGGGTIFSMCRSCTLNGNSAASGGGSFASELSGCELEGNVATDHGGAVDGSLLSNCILRSNTATWGGATYGGTLTDCTLTENRADWGGGAYESWLYDCALTSNRAWYYPGGAYNSTLSNCTLIGNSGKVGGLYYGTAENCRLLGNTASSAGGAAYGSVLLGCEAIGNTAGTNGGAAYYCALQDCVLKGNSAGRVGGAAYLSTLSNCVLVGNASFHGGGAASGTLYNCTLTSNSASYYGGGAYYSRLYACTLGANTSRYDGGGAFYSTLFNCLLVGNRSGSSGGGAYRGTLLNCMLTGNAGRGGGICYSSLTNSILIGNINLDGSGFGMNYVGGNLVCCCTTPMPDGPGNMTNDPKIVSFANPRLLPDSPCINAGTNQGWMLNRTDWTGRPRIGGGTVDIGACEFYSGVQTSRLNVAATANWTNVAAGFATEFMADIQGECLGYDWKWGDGQTSANAVHAKHAFSAPGTYAVVLQASNLTMTASATVTVYVAAQTTYYVSPAGGHIAPFTSWASAATTIQAAVDAALRPGDLVLVTNGIYETGGVTNYPVGVALTNRVAIHKPITVRSVNGPAVTAIKGAKDPITTNGDAAVRCVWLTSGAELIGFTLANGATRNAGSVYNERSGGGVWCQSPSAAIWNCIISGNSAVFDGGGAYHGTLHNCVLVDNSADRHGGGTIGGTLHNCTLAGNKGQMGAGAIAAELYDCILYFNEGANYSYSILSHCCAIPLPPGPGNITNNPQFVDAAAGDFRLLPTSPCVNAGMNQDWMVGAVDLDGNPRVVGGTVDMGAYEWQAAPGSLQALTFNEGGTGTYGAILQWSYADLATTETVRIEYSPDAGESWLTLARWWPICETNYTVVFMAPVPATTAGLWAVSLECDPQVRDQNDHTFTALPWTWPTVEFCRVSGHVLARGVPIAGALVSAMSVGIPACGFAVPAGSDGTYELTLPIGCAHDGRWRIDVWHPGFLDNTNLIFVTESTGAVIVVDFELAPRAEYCGLPALDSDGDGVPNGEELAAGTNPYDPASVFRVTDAWAGGLAEGPAPLGGLEAGGGLIVRWSSEADRRYRVERATEFREKGLVFDPIAIGVPATPPTNTYTDATATGNGPWVYRIRLETGSP